MNDKNCCESKENDSKKCSDTCYHSKCFIWWLLIGLAVLLIVFSSGYLIGKSKRFYGYGKSHYGCPMKKMNTNGGWQNGYGRGQNLPVTDSLESSPSASSTNQ